MKLREVASGMSTVAMVLLLAQTASATDLCLLANGAVTLVGKNLAIPAKGICKPWAGYVVAQPGNILIGGSCGSAVSLAVIKCPKLTLEPSVEKEPEFSTTLGQ